MGKADDRFVTLKRRVVLLSRLAGELVVLADGPYVVAVERVITTAALVTALREHGTVDLATLLRCIRTKQAPVKVDTVLLTQARREIRALAAPPALALARERRRVLARHGTIDEVWLRAREHDVARAAEALDAFEEHGAPPKERWFDTVIAIVRAREGEAAGRRVQNTRDEIVARAAERRARARERVVKLASGTPTEADLATLAERLERAREMPGRARRRRVLDVLRAAVGWPEAPAEAIATELDALRTRSEAFVEHVRTAGLALADLLPALRDPKDREGTMTRVAWVVLGCRIGDGAVIVPPPSADATKLLRFATCGVTAEQAVALVRLAGSKLDGDDEDSLARHVAQGLDPLHVFDALDQGWAALLAQAPDVRAARAYAMWSARLRPHYAKLGIDFKLPPRLFARLPRNADAGLLALCLFDVSSLGDPAAVLDQTLGLFEKLPAKAGRILDRLRGSAPAGAARRLAPEMAEWLDDDALLDRLVHIAGLAGESVEISRQIREDFEHAEKAMRELAHLESLDARGVPMNVPQKGRLALLRKGPRTLADAPKARTKRRISDRIEALLPIAYRRELDASFKEIMRDAWGIAVPALTEAWRDAVRFWLVVDDNRDLLGRLLREASNKPGADVKLTSAKNRAWAEKAAKEMNVAAWLAPRRTELVAPSGARYAIALEEDPLEVLRMGIPFGTCLSLEDGVNAASTVLNAYDANKRVLYVRGQGGKVVARKLLAVGEKWELLGYSLYLSTRGGDELALRSAVDAFCMDLARAAGLRLGFEGTPIKIHDGFWYDDGTVSFGQDEKIAAFCDAQGLVPAPEATWYGLERAARVWHAMETESIDDAKAQLIVSDRDVSGMLLGRFLVDRLGLTAATRQSKSEHALLPSVCRVLGDAGDEGFAEAVSLMGHRAQFAAHYTMPVLLGRAPPSDRVALALAQAVARVRSREKPQKYDVGHHSFDLLASYIDGVEAAFDVLDVVEPAWAAHVKRVPGCKTCRAEGERRLLLAIRAAYERAPERAGEAVAACLTSARRSKLAHGAALFIASRHALPNGDRAMTRFMTASRELARTPVAIAASIRQSTPDEITEAFARKLPAPAGPLFEALGPLLFSCAGIARVVERSPEIADANWEPGAWELAWRRRPEGRDGARIARLVETALRSPYAISRARELLALLADEEAMQTIERAQKEWDTTKKNAPGAPLPDAKILKGHFDIDRAARTLARQVRAKDFSEVNANVFDRLYVARAKEAAARGDASAAEVLAEARRFVELLGLPSTAANDAALARVLERTPASELTAERVVLAWQRPAVRAKLIAALDVPVNARSLGGRIEQVERTAERMSLPVDGFAGAAVIAALESSVDWVDGCFAESADQLREIVRGIVRDGAADHVARRYLALSDGATIVAFLAAVRRLPLDRAAAIRAAVTSATASDAGDVRRKALAHWMQSTRKRTSRAIERG